MATAKRIVADKVKGAKYFCLFGTYLPYAERRSWIFDVATLANTDVFLCHFQIQWSFLSIKWCVVEFYCSTPINSPSADMFETLGLREEYESIIELRSSCFLSRGENNLWIELEQISKKWRWHWADEPTLSGCCIVDFNNKFRAVVSTLAVIPA